MTAARRALDNISAESPTLSLYCLRPIDTLCHLIDPPRQTLLGSAKKRSWRRFCKLTLSPDFVVNSITMDCYMELVVVNSLIIVGWLVSPQPD